MFNKQAISINRKIKLSLYKLRHQQIEDLDDFQHNSLAASYKNLALYYVRRHQHGMKFFIQSVRLEGCRKSHQTPI